jgi:hypothetical protein
MAKTWSDVAGSSAFQALSLDQQEEARAQYFDSMVAPRVPSEDLDAARSQFFESTKLPEAAPVVKPEEKGIIQRVKDFVSPEYKSVLETQAPTPQQEQANINQRLSLGAGPISKETAAKADLLRSGMLKEPATLPVQKAAAGLAEQNVPTFAEISRNPEREAELAQQISRQQFAEENPLLGSAAAGAAGMLSGVINTPTVAADVFNKTVIDPVLQVAGFKPMQRVGNMFGTEYLAKAASDFTPSIGKKSMAGAWERSEMAPWLMSKLAANSPQVAQQLIAAFVPPLRAGMLLGMSSTAAGQSFAQGDDSRVAMMKGAIEYGTEKLPLGVFDKVGDMFKGMPVPKQNAILAIAGQRLLQAGTQVTANTITNAIEETAAQYGGNVLDKYLQGKDIELTKGLAEAGVVGGLTGAMMTTPQVASTLSGANELPFEQPAPEVSTAEQMAKERGFLTPERKPTQLTNFTPADSPTKAAGLVDVVVPVPVAAPAVTPLAEVQINPATEQQFGLDKLRLGTTNVGVPSTVGTTNVPSGAGGGVENIGGVGAAGPSVSGGTQPSAAATTAAQLGGGQVATAGAANGQQPTTLKQEWYGRRGDGYLTKPDAEQALPGRQRMYPDLQWSVEPLPTGKFRLAGYETETPQETTLGTQTTQAVQAAQEGQQQAPTFGAATTAPTIGAPTPNVQGAGLEGLTLAPQASMRVISSVRKALIKENVEIAPVPQVDMSESQKAASAVANMLGKTLTVVRYESGDQSAMPNGMIDKLGGNNIFVANDTEDSPLFVVMHEAHHGLPEGSRIKLNTALNSLFKEEMRGEFAREFNYTEDKLDEEIPAFMVQAISKRADFWEQLRAKMGNKDFADVAKHILSKLNEIVTGARKEYGNDFVTKYIKDVEKARDLLTTAYADAINNKAPTADAKQVAPVTGPVTKDEAVVDGVMYSARSRDLVKLPTVQFKDLLGKRVFGIKADLTDAGVSYTGIDGSQLEFPIEMMGGPNFVALPANVRSNVIWAVRGGATLTKIMKVVGESDYIIVHAMNNNSHLTNATISQAYIQTVEAYLKDKRISVKNLRALDKIVRSPANKNSLPDFVGFESPNIIEYIDGLSFDQRGALAKILEKKEAQIHGLPNLDRFRRETIDPEYAGYRQGDAMLVIEVDKKNPTVKLGEEGTKMHPSYPLGLRGKVVGKLAKGINYELIYRDYFENKVPTLANKEAGAWYTFDRVMPVQEITPEIAASVSEGGYTAIKSARQAEASLALANNNWLVSGKTKAEGGVSVQEFVDALAANEGAAALTMYTPEQVKAGIKGKSFSVYQLGKQSGDKGLQVFFGLKRGAPWYKGMIDGVSDNEVEVVSVTNNETGAQGVGIPAIITKAIQEGATILDAFAVKSKRFPDGFLPEMYSQFGFETIGSIPFDSSFYDANQMADLKKFWADGGWKESDGYPDVVVMKWKGNDDERATSIERYVREGETSVSVGSARFNGATTADAHGQRNQPRAKQGRGRGANAGQAGGDQGTGNAAPVVRRAYDSIQELASLSDGDIRNLGLDSAEVAKLRESISGIQFSKRGLNESAGGPSVGRDPSGASGSVKVVGAVHYGKQAGLSMLSGTSSGTGIKGAEQQRLAQPEVDPRIKRRVYFYLPVEGGIPQAEIGLGTNVYAANLSNLYDPSSGVLKAPSEPNAFESFILDSGYRGYINREQGTAVVLNSDVPVKAVGRAETQTILKRKPQVVAPKITTQESGNDLVRKPTEREMMDIIKVRPQLNTAAPSFKLEFGSARVAKSEADEANAVFEEAGSTFMFSNRAKPEYTHVVFDPRNNDKVMGKYQSIEAARRGQDRLDNQYGGYRYQIREIKTNEVRFSNRSMGQALQDRVDNDFDSLVQEYNAIKGTDGGRILDADMARELSPEYRENKTRAAEVHSAVSSFIEKLFKQRVIAAKKTGGAVVLTSGGGGAGKSSANEFASSIMKNANTIWDGTLSTPEKADKAVNLILENNQVAYVVYTYRDPVDALANPKGGVLDRAMKTRRVVPIYSLVKTHTGSSKTVRMLDEKYGDDKRFKLLVIDNSLGKGNAKVSSLNNITPVIQSGLKEKLLNETEQAYANGSIDREVYERTIEAPIGQGDTTQVSAVTREDGQGDERVVQERSRLEQSRDALTKLFTDLRGARGLKLARVQEQVENNPLSAAIKNVEENFYDIIGQLEEDGLIKINCK